MAKIHPGHEVLSLFGMAQSNTALNQSAAGTHSQHSVFATLVSAFLIILVASLILAFATGNFNLSVPTVAPQASVTNSGAEAVAFEPSRAVSQAIAPQGYLSR